MAKGPSKIIVLTGISRGLGYAMAKAFSAAGHLVIGCGTKLDTLTEVSKELGKPHEASVVDIGSAAEVSKWAKRIIKKYGAPDLLINNAGVINTNAPLWRISEEEFSEVLRINVSGTTNLIRAFCPAMIEHGSGVIVNFTSTWGRSTSPEVAPYCASKWAVEGLTQAFSQELPRGLVAVTLNPGIINTEMLQKTFGQGATAYEDPEEWAKRAVPFILKISAKDNGKALSVS